MIKNNKLREEFEKINGYDVYAYFQDRSWHNPEIIGFCENYVEFLENKILNKEKSSNEAHSEPLQQCNVMRSIYFWLYAVSKLGMLYTIFQENWIGLIGFGIATGVSYVEMMKHS